MSNKANAKKNRPPDWFPLSKYGKDYTESGWLEEIFWRTVIKSQYITIQDTKKSIGANQKVLLEPLKAFNSMIINDKHLESIDAMFDKSPVGKLWPARDPTPFELLFFSQKFPEKDYEKAKLWATRLHKEPRKWIDSFYQDGIRKELECYQLDDAYIDNINCDPDKNYAINIVGKCALVRIDLNHDDETIRDALDIWLAGIRDTLNEKAKIPVGEKDFTKWTRYKLLEAFDLVFWSQVNSIGYTDAFIARTLWPDFSNMDDFVDVTERYRKVTKPMIKEVFNWNYVERFIRQIELSNALKSLIAKKKAEQKTD